jgi:hypothetical protein
MQLSCLDINQLIAAAGGDPWKIDESLQSGRPIQISDLAKAFHDAGRCTAESSKAFDEACRRFEASWNRENGDHPINDTAEVQRATQSLGVQAAQLPKIGVDLEGIAAVLAETQRVSATQISSLDAQLKDIDGALGHLLYDDHDPAETPAIQQRINELINLADADTKSTLNTLESLRDGYTDHLEKAVTNLRVDDGYDPAPIQGIDDDGKISHDEHDQNAVKNYDAKQRELDQALVNSPGGMTPEKADAAARLRDYATVTNPAADLDARRLASERLDDFAMARFTGPLPTDPILGGDARSRAQMRLEWQKKFEQGLPGGPPMNPDQVTQLLDNGEQEARAVVMQQAVKGLVSQGMSPNAAKAVAGDVARGIPWAEITKQQGQIVTLAGAGVDGTVAARGGRHAVDAFTPEDVKAFERVGKVLGGAGAAVDVALALNDWAHGAGFGESAGKAGGSIGGGWLGGMAGGAAAGSVIGPEGAFVGAILGAAAGAWGGEKLGGIVGGQLDK